MQENVKIVRTYKDSFFVDLFGKCPEARENFLSLYNAMHGTTFSIKNTQVEPLMLDQTVYIGRYNDVSMLVNGRVIVLVEQQSTINENMPLRFLEYISRLYEKLILLKERYRHSVVALPSPEFYVIYNGNADYPAERTLHLSDAFRQENEENGSNKISGEKDFPLELSVKVYNINKQKDIPFVAQCGPLSGYAKFIMYDREAIFRGDPNHVDYAIQRCIKEGILSDYLQRNSTEVHNMLIAEYDYETDISVQREEAYKQGIAKQKAEDEKQIQQQAAEIARLKAQLAKLQNSSSL